MLHVHKHHVPPFSLTFVYNTMKNPSTTPATVLHIVCAIASLLLTQSLYILARDSTGKISKTNLQVLKNRIDSRSYSLYFLDLVFVF